MWDRHGGTPPRDAFRKGVCSWERCQQMAFCCQSFQELLQLQGVTLTKVNSSWGGPHPLAYRDTAISFQCRPSPKSCFSTGAREGQQRLSSGLTQSAILLCPHLLPPLLLAGIDPHLSLMNNPYTTLHLSVSVHFPGNPTGSACMCMISTERL